MTSSDSPKAHARNNPRETRALEQWHACSRPTLVVEPDLPIVDAHHHLYGSAEEAYFYDVETLKKDLDAGHRIIGSVYVEAYASGWRTTGPEALRPVGETERIVGATGKAQRTESGSCSVAAGIVAHADLSVGDAVDEVLHAHIEAGDGRLRGIRQRAATTNLLAQAGFRRGVSRLSAFGLCFETWVPHPQSKDVAALADEFPYTTFVLDHITGPLGLGACGDGQAGMFREWREGLRALAARPNIVLKVGGMGMPIIGFGFHELEHPPAADALALAWRPAIETCVEVFGPNRCMLESNFPVDKQSCSYGELWNAFKHVTRTFSRRERGDLFFGTACRAYRLEDLAQVGNAWLDSTR